MYRTQLLSPMRNPVQLFIAQVLSCVVFCSYNSTAQLSTPLQTVPPEWRGKSDYEREGTHDANNIRTFFKNFGMVGGYFDQDPVNVDLSVFHSVEVPKGSGMNYSDGITPFVLAKIKQNGVAGEFAWIMETGFRERQQKNNAGSRVMKFEPRPGYMQLDQAINRDRSPAMSNLERTWPDEWYDKKDDANDPGWKGSWNGYFGKKAAADQESFYVMDDDYYDAWDYTPDSRDATRHGLGLRIETRGFQWTNPQAGNVIFWHYDIANEGTTDYNDNIIFGLYMDSGVGGSGIGCDPLPESDDDNAYYDHSTGMNLVYTWDTRGHGKSLVSNCGQTGYLGYAYMETPGKPDEGIDNDGDGITDEKREDENDVKAGKIVEGQKVIGQQAILAYVNAQYTVTKFEAAYGPVTSRPAYKAGVWWTGDEDMDWVAEFNDTGEDGVFETNDKGEKDGKPTVGETNFGKTDLHESDQIGLTGFKMNRIRAGDSNPGGATDGIVFFYDGTKHWPKLLYDQFTDPTEANRFGPPLTNDYNIAFLFASGTFRLPAGSRERFSLALAYGSTLEDLKRTVIIVQQIYNANYQFAVPPPPPTLKAESGDRYVRLSWDDVAERSTDPVTYQNDFEGYKIYRSTDPNFLDTKLISNGQGTGPMVFGKPIVQYDVKDKISGYSKLIVDGVAYYLGDETGIQHTFKDTTVLNGQVYYYAVVAYDFGSDSIGFYPSENAISISQTPRGGIVLPKNAVEVRPEPKVTGYLPAEANSLTHRSGKGKGNVTIEVVNSNLVPDNRTMFLRFKTEVPDNIRADYYELVDSASGKVYIDRGTDFSGTGSGQVGVGLKPVIGTDSLTAFNADTTVSRFVQKLSATNVKLKAVFNPGLQQNARHFGYPYDLVLRFSSTVIDTSVDYDFSHPPLKSKLKVFAIKENNDSVQLKYVFNDANSDSTLSGANDYLDIVDTTKNVFDLNNLTWRIQLDTLGQFNRGTIIPPAGGDVYFIGMNIPLNAGDSYSFTTRGQRIDPAKSKREFTREPYVVPNPYVGAASFEPERFSISGRGERRMEFRGLPALCAVRIYTVNGNLVQTLYHDGSNDSYVAWNLRTKDNLDVAPGLYIFHVDGGSAGSHVGKFAIIK